MAGHFAGVTKKNIMLIEALATSVFISSFTFERWTNQEVFLTGETEMLIL